MTEPSRAVFLSYASQDAEAAKRICEALTVAGIEVWFDQSELRSGDAWDLQIRQQIRDCALVIPIISADTQARAEGYFRLEWKLAVERTHLMSERMAFLVPVVIDDTGDAEADVPDKFRTVQWTRLPDGDTPPSFVERIGRLLSPSVTPAAPLRPSPASCPNAKRRSGSGSGSSPFCPINGTAIVDEVAIPHRAARGAWGRLSGSASRAAKAGGDGSEDEPSNAEWHTGAERDP